MASGAQARGVGGRHRQSQGTLGLGHGEQLGHCPVGSAVHYGLEPGRDALPERSGCCVGKGGRGHSYRCTWLEGVASVQGKTVGAEWELPESLKGDMTRARGLTSGGQRTRILVVGGGAALPYTWTEALDKQHRLWRMI